MEANGSLTEVATELLAGVGGYDWECEAHCCAGAAKEESLACAMVDAVPFFSLEHGADFAERLLDILEARACQLCRPEARQLVGVLRVMYVVIPHTTGQVEGSGLWCPWVLDRGFG